MKVINHFLKNESKAFTSSLIFAAYGNLKLYDHVPQNAFYDKKVILPLNHKKSQL
ncbi:hypothetical protein J2750_000512 [Methanococcoides alaskense]|uniref:Uncharacterized protein n=1 Tax=Methanococcoides alaskense TaxID=325778 RepID=A0AA90Z6J4_9EURY|nr:hypothetical protein [Methanococcoides alaskense]